MGASQLGGWAISKQLFDWLVKALPKGSTILELGSGSGTQELSMHFRMVSVEHDPKFVGRYASTYIYAPIVDDWYDAKSIAEQLGKPAKYDLLLVDGPPGRIGRSGILKHLDLFDLDKLIVLDDVERPAENELLKVLATRIGRTPTIFAGDDKSFGIL